MCATVEKLDVPRSLVGFPVEANRISCRMLPSVKWVGEIAVQAQITRRGLVPAGAACSDTVTSCISTRGICRWLHTTQRHIMLLQPPWFSYQLEHIPGTGSSLVLASTLPYLYRLPRPLCA